MRYIGEFSDYNNTLYQVEINTNNGTGTTSITLGGTPFVEEMGGSTDDLFKPVRYSTASINIVSDKYLFDIYSNKNDINVKVTSNGITKWIGIVEPLIFNMGYNTEVEEITIECIDYLTALEHIKFDDLTLITNRPMMSFIELYRFIIGNYTRYNYLYYPNIFSKNLLDQKISVSNFIDEKCYIENGVVNRIDKNWTLKDIIEEMNKYMGLTLVAYGENLYLIPYLSLQKTISWQRYTINSTAGPTSAGNLDHKIGVSNLYDGSDLSLLPIYNQFSVKVNANKIEHILPEFLKNEKLVNITSESYCQNPTGILEDRYEQMDADDNLTISSEGSIYGDFQFFKSTDRNVKAYEYMYFNNPTVTTVPKIGENLLQVEYFHGAEETPHYSRVFGRPYGGIMNFRKRLKEPENDLPYGKNTVIEEWQKYIFLNESAQLNMNGNSILPLFSIKSVPVNITNKMALRFDAELLSTVYWRMTVVDELFYLLDYPIEREDIKFSNVNSNAESRNKIFGWVGVQIRVGNYYFNNFNGVSFIRKGYWQPTPCIARLYFDAMQGWPTYRWNKITDNSLDKNIQEDKSGYWVKFDTLPVASMEGDIEITFYPNGEQVYGLECTYKNTKMDGFKVNGKKYNGFGLGTDKSHFIKDFEVELVIPRDKTVTEEDWNADTVITNIVDSNSFQEATEIDLKIHSDFGKAPAFSTVPNSGTYRVNTIQTEPAHLAEEWLCFNNATQYSEVHKVLESSVKEEIRPWTLVTMTGRPHFNKMMVDTYKKDYRTGLTDVTLVELSNI